MDANIELYGSSVPNTELYGSYVPNTELYGSSVPNECLFGVRMQLILSQLNQLND
jgi:hypothetical protein